MTPLRWGWSPRWWRRWWRRWCLAAVLTAIAAGSAVAADARRSGRDDMGAATRAIQDDDAQNPAVLWLPIGESQWRLRPRPIGGTGTGTSADTGAQTGTGRSCADCHAPASTAAPNLADVATRYPAFDTLLGRPLTLGQRVNACRERHQGLPALRTDSDELLGLETWLARRSRGQPIQSPSDPRLAAWVARGEARFRQRVGQLDLSCAHCHDERAGGRLGGALIPQGHPTGYPQYRLEWQALGSLQRRLRNCLVGVRAEPFADGAVEWTELELYLKQRAAGMPLETPAVRP